MSSCNAIFQVTHDSSSETSPRHDLLTVLGMPTHLCVGTSGLPACPGPWATLGMTLRASVHEQAAAL